MLIGLGGRVVRKKGCLTIMARDDLSQNFQTSFTSPYCKARVRKGDAKKDTSGFVINSKDAILESAINNFYTNS